MQNVIYLIFLQDSSMYFNDTLLIFQSLHLESVPACVMITPDVIFVTVKLWFPLLIEVSLNSID